MLNVAEEQVIRKGTWIAELQPLKIGRGAAEKKKVAEKKERIKEVKEEGRTLSDLFQ